MEALAEPPKPVTQLDDLINRVKSYNPGADEGLIRVLTITPPTCIAIRSGCRASLISSIRSTWRGSSPSSSSMIPRSLPGCFTTPSKTPPSLSGGAKSLRRGGRAARRRRHQAVENPLPG